MPGRLKEKFLLFRIRAKKDPDAFGAVYDAYVKQIYRFVYFKVPSAEIAEDLTSEAFLKAWQYLKEKREVNDLQALLYSVARSVVIDWYRANAHERTVSLDETMSFDGMEPASEKLLKQVEAGLDTTLVLEKVRCLKDEYRDVIVMRYLDELSTREIAEVLGKSPSNIRVLIHRATKALTDAVNNAQQGTHNQSPKNKE